uniref:Uncharacterized protein n=1 Tax=Oryza meridionalis TaxID=40149 RepID=A0A0E0DLK3_9ORYZ
MEKSRRAHFLFDDDDQTPPKQNGPQNDDQHNNDDGRGCLCVWCYGGGVAKPKAKSSSSTAKDVVAGGRPAAGSNCT